MAEKTAPSASSGSGAGATAAVAALLTNLGIALAKFVGFLVTGASSMLAEAGGRPQAPVRARPGPLLLGLPGRGAGPEHGLRGVGLAALTGDPLYDGLGILAIGVPLAVAQVELDQDLSADDAARVIDDAQDRLHTATPNARIVYLEPQLPVPADSTADAPTRTSEP